MSKDFVVKLAQPGFDVKTTGDENLIYSSKWPLLKIYKQGSYTINNTRTTQVIATHDLGYTPFFWYYVNQGINAWMGVSTVSDPTRSEFYGMLGGGNNLYIDDNKLIYRPAGATLPGSYTIYYYIFTLPLTEEYAAPQIKTGGLSNTNKSHQVLKLAKPSKDISSSNLEDYVIHSDARSPMINNVINRKLGTDGVNSIGIQQVTAQHNLGYKPMFFGFFQQDDDSYILLSGTSITIPGVLGFLVDEQKVTYAYPSINKISIVVLKDPFNVDYSIQVNI